MSNVGGTKSKIIFFDFRRPFKKNFCIFTRRSVGEINFLFIQRCVMTGTVKYYQRIVVKVNKRLLANLTKNL